MTARLRKEARALLPYWAGTLALVVAPCVLGKSGAALSLFSYCFGCALLGGISFGHELEHRTFPMLLSQPIARSVIWRDKMLTLATALLTTTAVLVIASRLSGSTSWFDADTGVEGDGLWFLPFVALFVICGAPLLTLVSGSTLGGAILSLAVPGCCFTLAMGTHLVFPAVGIASMGAGLVLVWCLFAAVLGYTRFRTYQARPPRSLTLAIPTWLLPRTSSARRGPLGALLRKELRLQYGTVFLVVPLWGIFFLGGVLSRTGSGNWSAITSVVTGVSSCAASCVAGAIALGEERTLGVADWQLSLPPSARLQWLAKMLVTISISLVLGLVVPLSLVRPVPGPETLLVLVVGYLLLTHLAIYAGSLAKGTIPAVLLALGFWSAAGIAVLYGGLLEKGAVKLAIEMAALLVILHAFAFSNFRQRGLQINRIGLQGLTVSGLLAILFAV